VSAVLQPARLSTQFDLDEVNRLSLSQADKACNWESDIHNEHPIECALPESGTLSSSIIPVTPRFLSRPEPSQPTAALNSLIATPLRHRHNRSNTTQLADLLNQSWFHNTPCRSHRYLLSEVTPKPTRIYPLHTHQNVTKFTTQAEPSSSCQKINQKASRQ
jgi:hypothetical protein